jgi:hypothetical protein
MNFIIVLVFILVVLVVEYVVGSFNSKWYDLKQYERSASQAKKNTQMQIEHQNLCCTDFFERPDGTVVKAYGFGREGVMLYDEYGTYFTVPMNEVATWRSRTDLKLFPGCPDEVLPYEFDLFMDVKCVSDLPVCDDQMRDELMASYGITMKHAKEVRRKTLAWYKHKQKNK